MVGEWVPLPVLHGARGGVAGQTGDRLYDQVLHPTAHRLLARCDAVLRLPGASAGADNDVKIAHARGIPVFHAQDEIPHAR